MEATQKPALAAAAPLRGWRSLLTGRWHRSSWLVAALVLLFLVFCNVPGQLVVYVDADPAEWAVEPSDERLEHGWPLTWGTRYILSWPPGGISTLEQMDCWAYWESIELRGFDGKALAINVAVIVVCAVAAGIVFELWRRARARVWQLHLRDMMGIVFFVSLGGGWYAYEQRRHARQQQVLEKLPVSISASVAGSYIVENQAVVNHAPTWLRLLDDGRFQFLDRVVAVSVDRDGLPWAAELPDLRVVCVAGEVSTSSLSHLERLPRLELLDLSAAQKSGANPFRIGRNRYIPSYGNDSPADPTPRLSLPPMPRLRGLRLAGNRYGGISELKALEVLWWSGESADAPFFKEVASLPKLRTLVLNDCALVGDGLQQLASCSSLESLTLSHTTIADDTVKQLAGLTQLQELKIVKCPFSGRGLVHLAPLTRLESVDFSDTSLGDEGIEHLASLPNLRKLTAGGTRVSDKALAHLKKMPNLRELTVPGNSKTSQTQYRIQAELPKCRVTFEK